MSYVGLINTLLQAGIGINATRYLSAAGLVVLLYDHLLLLGPEIRIVWKAKWTHTKGLFFWNRYFVPVYLMINAYVISGLSTAGLSPSFCRTWIPITLILGVTSLAFTNVFIMQRLWALWGRSMTILKILIAAFTCAYVTTYILTAFMLARMIPQISYLPFLRSCIITKKPAILMAMYAVPLGLDVFVFILTCWNAFDRPRHMQTAITRQLITDGVVYFIAVMALRLFNILVLAIGDVAYQQLGVYFLWSMITALVNRMLIMSGTVEVHPGLDPSGRQTPFDNPDLDGDEDNYDYYYDNPPSELPSFIELSNKPYTLSPIRSTHLSI